MQCLEAGCLRCGLCRLLRSGASMPTELVPLFAAIAIQALPAFWLRREGFKASASSFLRFKASAVSAWWGNRGEPFGLSRLCPRPWPSSQPRR